MGLSAPERLGPRLLACQGLAGYNDATLQGAATRGQDHRSNLKEAGKPVMNKDKRSRLEACKIVSGILAVLALAAPSAHARRLIISYRHGTAAKSLRDQVIERLRASRLFDIADSAGGGEFMAQVVEVPDSEDASPVDIQGASAKIASQGGFDSQDVQVEEDFWTNWLRGVSFQRTPFLDGASMGDLGIAPLSGRLTRPASSDGKGPAPTPAPGQNVKPQLPWGVARVDAPAAWPATKGAGVKVCVVDTGVDPSHPDLAGVVAGGVNIIAGNNDFSDDNGHGTHVAGTIAAIGRYAAMVQGKPTLVVGVAPRVSIYAVKVMNAQGEGRLSDIVRGIMWCANHKAQVMNMSLGSDTPAVSEERAVTYAQAHGVVPIAASGNTGKDVGYPAAYPEVIAVGASDANDQVASFSSRGPQVRFIAPGDQIISTWMNGGYAAASGTSMASPHVAALAALAVSEGARGFNQVLSTLQAAATPLKGLTKKQQGFGMIDAKKLVR